MLQIVHLSFQCNPLIGKDCKLFCRKNLKVFILTLLCIFLNAGIGGFCHILSRYYINCWMLLIFSNSDYVFIWNAGILLFNKVISKLNYIDVLIFFHTAWWWHLQVCFEWGPAHHKQLVFCFVKDKKTE